MKKMSIILLLALFGNLSYCQLTKVSKVHTISVYDAKAKKYIDLNTSTSDTYITWKSKEIRFVCIKCAKTTTVYSIANGPTTQRMDRSTTIDTYVLVNVETGAKVKLYLLYDRGSLFSISVISDGVMIMYMNLEDY
jgi:hypothetical protein